MNIKDVSDQLTLCDLENMANDPNATECLLKSYESILDGIESEDLPEACNAIAFNLQSSIIRLHDLDKAQEVHRHVVNICRRGINELSDGGLLGAISPGSASKTFEMMELYSRMSASMFYLHRPVSAFHYLDCAENCYKTSCELGCCNQVLDIMYEHCRAKEAEYYIDLVEDIPEKYRALFSVAGSSYLGHAVENMIGLGENKALALDYYTDSCTKGEKLKTAYPMPQQKLDQIRRIRIEDDYLKWCQENVKLLSILNEIPDVCTCDDIELNLDEKHQWLLEDVVKTYDHCRRLFYDNTRDMKKILLDDRCDQIECVIDCFVRLYTLLDKSAKLITYLFPQDGSMERLHFFDVAKTLHNDPNPYLRSIYGICRDIFPDTFDDSKRTFDPRNNHYGIVLKRGFIRNSIIHGTLKMFNDVEEKNNFYNVASITPSELIQCTDMMMYDVREIVLNIQLAVEYRKTH